MLNRIALSGGTYKDWIDTVYTSGFELHAETPIYCGGSSAEIIFNEVVATGGEEVLGTLAGRGTSVGHKNGKLKIKVKKNGDHVGSKSKNKSYYDDDQAKAAVNGYEWRLN